jgi:hypothetical protein
LHHPELLYFADVCAGPGGFSEYVLWRSKAEAKGFGMTLRGSCDFKLEDFFAGPAEMFEPLTLFYLLTTSEPNTVEHLIISKYDFNFLLVITSYHCTLNPHHNVARTFQQDQQRSPPV